MRWDFRIKKVLGTFNSTLTNFKKFVRVKFRNQNEYTLDLTTKNKLVFPNLTCGYSVCTVHLFVIATGTFIRTMHETEKMFPLSFCV